MAENGRIIRADFLSWTAQGRPWADFEWLIQLVYHGAFSALGFAGLLAVRAAFTVGLGWVLWRVVALYGLPLGPRSALFFIAAGAITPFLDVRPDNASLLLFGATLWALERRRLSPAGARALPPLGAVAAFFCLWANLHLGFLFGLVLIACYAAGEAITAALPALYGKPRGRLDGAGALAAAAAAGAAAALINPYGPRLYAVVWEHVRDMGAIEAGAICEWLPADATLPLLWPYWALLVAAFAATLIHFLRTRRTPYEHLLTLFYFALVSSSQRRHVPYLCLVAAAQLAWTLKDAGLTRRRPRLALGLCALLVGTLALHQSRRLWPLLRFTTAAPLEHTPERMVRFLEAERGVLSGLRLYNTWGEGGYLGFRLHPDYAVFLDGRYLFHPWLERVDRAKESPLEWRRMLDELGIELALLKRQSINYGITTKLGTFQLRPYFVTYMPEADWALVWWDERYLVMVRRTRAPKAWLAAREYRLLRPGDEPELRSRLARGEITPAGVDSELTRHLSETDGGGEEDARLRAWLARLKP